MKVKFILIFAFTILLLGLSATITLAAELQPLEQNLDLSGTQNSFLSVPVLIAVPIAASSVSSSSASGVSAEHLLQGLAEDEKSGRIIGGSLLIGSGAILMLAGTGFDSEYASPFYIIGGSVALSGLIVISIPTATEQCYLVVTQISDPEEREEAAANCLFNLAVKAKVSRLMNGITSAGLAILYFSQSGYESDDYDGYSYDSYLGVTFAVDALYFLLAKSPAELAWERYETGGDARQSETRYNFQIGFNPKNGGLSLGYKLAL